MFVIVKHLFSSVILLLSSTIFQSASLQNSDDMISLSSGEILSSRLYDQEKSDSPNDMKVCPSNMMEIEGDYCPIVEQKCLKWIDDKRCAEFQEPSTCLSSRKHLHYCMAKFEYPGAEGSYPIVGINYYQAKELVEKESNRLCTVEEFNFACEGEQMFPYGYGNGYRRDAEACNIDKPWINYTNYHKDQWNDLNAGLYQGVRSDGNSQCKSWSGVYNLNGNVDEILSSDGVDYVILSGGYWGPVRDRCRPKTIAHDKGFAFYQISTRACSDILEK
jgi:formylglycine-generating enzyme